MFCRTKVSTDLAETFLDRVIQSTELERASHLAIAGGGIEALIQLMKRGFTHAAAVLPDRCRAAESADAFLVLGIPTSTTVEETLHQAHATLRPQGVVAIHDAHPETGPRVRAWDRLAEKAGFSSVVAVPFGDGCIVTARRLDQAPHLAAA